MHSHKFSVSFLNLTSDTTQILFKYSDWPFDRDPMLVSMNWLPETEIRTKVRKGRKMDDKWHKVFNRCQGKKIVFLSISKVPYM